ncbi:ABC transporter substrate-binding protein [Aminobacter sp. HY435]|uniref:ABC transporter substrate-binding protein n=1 Tax=Aminobacter sp. HY435 TaxID=2970917 RepID=UPI0022B96DBE|nr:ABC transporter substrate-binding protein [Aminobacter sp. HY435]
MKFLRPAFLALALSTSLGGMALAADLMVGSSTEPQAIDPHYSRTGNSQQIAQQIFNRMIEPDKNLQVQPGLAVEWKAVDPLTWEVKLREGVTFSDGTPFTAEDVEFSINRAATIPNSPAPFTANVAPVASIEIVDPLTIRFKTEKPTPQFMELVGLVYIVSKKAAVGASIEDFNSGKATIGTGPYKFVSWTPGDRYVLKANPTYWGEKPKFENVTFRLMSNSATRVAALLSGDVDLIDAVPPNDEATLAKDPKVTLHSTPSGRIIYLGLDSARDESPFVTGPDGKPLKANPLKDARVRKAMSKMIDRQLLIDRVLSGAGTPAGQLAPEGVGGYTADLVADTIDIDGAKKLLAEAGVPDGFGITVHSSNDRFPGDGDVAQALGQLFQRGGLKVNGVVTQPYNVYAAAAGKQEFSAFIFSFGTTTASASAGMNNVLMTYSKEAGTGSFNRMRYSNADYDAKMREALAEFDTQKRNALLSDAAKIAFGDQAILPLYWPKVTWATRKGIDFVPNTSEDTLATYASEAK